MPYGSDPIQGAAPQADPPPGSVGLPEWAGGPKKRGYGHDPIQRAADPEPAGLPVLQDKIFGPGTAERALRYMGSPLIGMGQLAQTLLPLPGTSREAMSDIERDNEEKIAKLRGKKGGVDLERMVVDTLNPVNWATTAVAPEIRAGGALTRGAETLATRYLSPAAGRAVAGGVSDRAIPPIIGGLTAAEQPVDNAKTLGEFVNEKRKQIAGGMVGGKVGDSVTRRVGSVIAPTMGRGQQILHDLGVRMSPGQVASGRTQRAEEAMTSIPFVGTRIANAERRGVEDFNRAAVKQVLEPLGVALPDGIAAGHPAVKFAQGELDHAYESLLPNLQFSGRITPQFAGGLRTVFDDVTQLGPRYRNEFFGQMDRVLLSRLRANGGTLDGHTFKEVESAMTDLINDYATGDPMQKHLGRTFDQVLDMMRTELETQNPTHAGELAAVNRAYAMLSRVEDASMNTVTPDGVFMPSSLLREVRKAARQTGRRKSYAAGDAMMQDFGEAGQEVLPRTLRDSGTTERRLWTALLTSPAGVGAYEFGRPGAATGAAASALGIGALHAAYSEPAMRAFQNWFANAGPTRQAIGRGVSNAGAYVAPALGIAGGQATQ